MQLQDKFSHPSIKSYVVPLIGATTSGFNENMINEAFLIRGNNILQSDINEDAHDFATYF